MEQMERTKFKKNKERNLNSTFGKKEKNNNKNRRNCCENRLTPPCGIT